MIISRIITPFFIFAIGCGPVIDSEGPITTTQSANQTAEVLVDVVSVIYQEGSFNAVGRNDDWDEYGDFLVYDSVNAVGEARGTFVGSGSREDGLWEVTIDAEFDGYGTDQEQFTGHALIEMVVEYDGYRADAQTHTIGVLESSRRGEIDVDLAMDRKDRSARYDARYSGLINEFKVGGVVRYVEEPDEYYDDCKVPVGVDCG